MDGRGRAAGADTPEPLARGRRPAARGLEDRAVESEIAVTLARTIGRWLGEHPQEWEPDEFNPYHRAALAVIDSIIERDWDQPRPAPQRRESVP